MHGRRMRGLGGVRDARGGGKATALAGVGLAAERLRMLERGRPARFGERTDRDREREIKLEIAREAAAIKREETTVRALLLLLVQTVLNEFTDCWNACRCRAKRSRRLVVKSLQLETA